MRIEDVVTRFQQDGWCIVEGVIPEDKVGAVRDSVIKTVTEHEGGEPDEGGVTNPVRRGLINYDQSFAPYLADEHIVGTATALWGKFVKITITTPVVRMPGTKPTGWHADWPFNQSHPVVIKEPFPDFPMLMTVIFMLSPFTEETGGTMLAPASHRSLRDWNEHFGDNKLSPHQSQTQAIAPAGSVLMFDSRMWHSVPANRSDKVRAGVTVRYAPWWLNMNVMMPGHPEREFMVGEDGTQERNMQPPLRRDVFDSLPENVKPLFRHWVR
jgi:hypothetical protein